MEITLKCKCGAEATFEDQRDTYLNPGGSPDEKGRFFVIQKSADDWLELHKDCLKIFDIGI